MFDFNFTSFMGEMIGSFNGRRGFSDEIVTLAPLVASLNSPVYVSIPVKDAAIVDEFLDTLDPLLAARARVVPRGWWFDINYDFYQVEGVEFGKVRSVSLQLGPLKWRFFYARIGDGLYIASKRFLLDEMAQATAEAKKRGGSHQDSATAHAMIRVRPEHWNKVLDDYQLGWAENNRRAVLNNLGRLSNVARACIAMNPDAAKQDSAQVAERVLT